MIKYRLYLIYLVLFLFGINEIEMLSPQIIHSKAMKFKTADIFFFILTAWNKCFACANEMAIVMQRSILKKTKCPFSVLSISVKYCNNCKQSLEFLVSVL